MKTNVMPEVQVSDGMLRKYFCVKYFCRIVIAGTLKLNSYKLSKANGKSAKDYYLPSY